MVVLVLVGGASGAVLRYWIGLLLLSRPGVFPWGTFVVNVSGSLIAGGAAGAVAATSGPAWVLTLVGVGFCGALTTFSAFGYETVRLLEESAVRAAGLNVITSLAVASAGCAAGWALATALV